MLLTQRHESLKMEDMAFEAKRRVVSIRTFREQSSDGIMTRMIPSKFQATLTAGLVGRKLSGN